MHAQPERRSDPAPQRAAAPAAGRRTGAVDLPSLQHLAGNRAVQRALHGAVQRVPITQTGTTETLYNTETAGTGEAHASPYGHSSVHYDMARNGDTGVTVTVRIRYLSQSRNTTPPPPGAPPGTPALGQLIGSPAEIPENDPRRAWATTTAASALTHWNNRVSFVGVEHNLLSPDTTKRLPVTFRSEAVFGLHDEAHTTVIVHPPSTIPGSPGQPIDAGNYYMQDPAHRAAAYPHNDDIIYAHEYGHLIGIPDEYSQSNEMLNSLLHQAAPAGAPSLRAALDRTTVERMTLAALARPMYAQLNAVLPQVFAAISAQQRLVSNRMAAAARAGVRGADVRTELENELTAGSEPGLAGDVPRAVAFETTANFSNLDLARQGVEAGFRPGALAKPIGDAYWQALLAPQSANVAVAGFDDVSVDVSSAVYNSSGSGPVAAAAGGEATTAVGAVPAPGGGPGLPPVPAPDTLLAHLNALPAAWSAAGSALEAGVTPAAFGSAMVSALRSAAAASAIVAAAVALIPGAPATPQLASSRALYRRAHALVDGAAREAATQLATDLAMSGIRPVLTSSVATLQAAITAEVNRLMTTPPAGVARAGPADPNMAAVVAAMRTRLDADKAATAGTGRDPTHGGAHGATTAAPDQDVSYSAQGLMGSSNSAAIRVDQFQPMVGQFNDHFLSFWERRFHAEAR